MNGVPPLLYNADKLYGASTVCVVEGEKDADSITNLKLGRFPRAVTGVTSGSASSWHPSLAEHLVGKDVVLMPDADEPGGKYRDAVGASLDALKIAYRIVTFEDVGCKDVTNFLECFPVTNFIQRIGGNLVGTNTLT